MLGTWLFNEYLDTQSYAPLFDGGKGLDFNFICDNIQFEGLYNDGEMTESGGYSIGYMADLSTWSLTTVYIDDWLNQNYRTITITDTSSLTNRDEFTTWLKANAVKQTGGG